MSLKLKGSEKTRWKRSNNLNLGLNNDLKRIDDNKPDAEIKNSTKKGKYCSQMNDFSVLRTKVCDFLVELPCKSF